MPTGKIAAKVSHFEILCRVHGVEPTVGLFRCFYVNSRNKGWMSFSKRPDSESVCYTKPLDSLKRWNDHFFGSALLPVPLPFRGILVKLSLETLFQSQGSLKRMITLSLLLIRLRSRRHVVSLLPVAPARAESELEASMERLFDEGGSADQGDSGTGDGQETGTEIVVGVRIVVEENVAAKKPKRPQKKRQAATDADGSSHPPKKLTSDYETLSGAVNAGKSPSTLKELLAISILNSGVPADSVIGPNLRPIGVSKRFVNSSDSSHHSSTNASRAKGDSIIRSAVVLPVMTEAVITTHVASIPSASALEPNTKVITPVHASMFHDSDSTGTVRPDAAGSSYVSGKELSMRSREVDSESLHDVFISHFEELFTEISVGTSRQACLSAEVKMRTEYSLSERRRLESEFEKKAGLLKAKDDEVKGLKAQAKDNEVEGLKAQLMLKEAEAAEAIRLRVEVTDLEASVVVKERELTDLNSLITSVKSQNDILVDRVHELETSFFRLQEKVTMYENCMEQLERFQDDWMKVVNDKFDQLYTDFVEMSLHLEERFYPYLLTTISCCGWPLAQGMKLAIIKCLNSPEYVFALRASISKAIEKDVAAHNPFAEADYISALQKLQNVNFSLFAELKSNKDASVKTVMDILRMKEPFAEKLRLNELQPTVTNIRVQKIRENIVNQRSTLRDVFVSLAEPFSTVALTSTKSTSDIVSAAANTTMAPSTTLASASTVPPITMEDYEVMGTDGPEDAQRSGQGEVASFPNTVGFEKEELDTTPERDPPS
nr:hypothetical protein [Tanacetum cinerariifolium]